MVSSAILIPTVRRAWCRFVLATESTEFGRLELLSWVEALLEANVQMAEGAPFPPAAARWRNAVACARAHGMRTRSMRRV